MMKFISSKFINLSTEVSYMKQLYSNILYLYGKLIYITHPLVRNMPSIVFCLFFMLVAILSSKNYWDNLTLFHKYQLTDWQISYAGGFIRRGLLGEIILWVCAYTGAYFSLITALIAIVCNLIFTATSASLLYPFRNNHWVWLLIYGPCCFASGMIEKSLCGHKDVLLLMLASVIFFGAIRFVGRFRTIWVLACLALTIPLVLSHEGFVVFIPILFVALSSLRLTRPVIGMTILIVIGLAAASLASIKFSGTVDQRDAIIAAFSNAMPVQYSIQPLDRHTAVWFIGQNISDTLFFVVPRNEAGLLQLPLALLLSFGPLIIAMKMLDVRKVFSDFKGKICAGLIILSGLLLIALMTIVIDWMRFFIDMTMLITLAVVMRIRLVNEDNVSLLPGAERSSQNTVLRSSIARNLSAAFFLLKPGKLSPDLVAFGWKNAMAFFLIVLIANYHISLTPITRIEKK